MKKWQKYINDEFFIDEMDLDLDNVPEIKVDFTSGYCEAYVDHRSGVVEFKELSVALYRVFDESRRTVFIGRLNITEFVNKDSDIFERMSDNVFYDFINQNLA